MRRCPRTVRLHHFDSVERRAPGLRSGPECGAEQRAARPENRADGALGNAPPLFAPDQEITPLPRKVTSQPLAALLRSHSLGRLCAILGIQAEQKCSNNQEQHRSSIPIVKSAGQPPAKTAHTVPNATLYPRFDSSRSTTAKEDQNRLAGCTGPSKNRSTARFLHAGSALMAQPCKGWRKLADKHRPTLARLLIVDPPRPCRAVKPLRLRRQSCTPIEAPGVTRLPACFHDGQLGRTRSKPRYPDTDTKRQETPRAEAGTCTKIG